MLGQDSVNQPYARIQDEPSLVGTDVHTFDASRAQYRSQIPSMRAASQDTYGGSGTPIYDALYSEYRRLFRTLPGDRTGEEALSFNGFEPLQRAGRHRGAVPAALPPAGTDKRLHGL
ncbi:hypothetical protein [Actinacidiphila soli]|uniref:hypothetical protein n=1 Tax=Actinacidiphila soli TaxID=2487275 RepID=UPI001F0C870B|nr:hypothetical protein [Actinacidiphila soli]